MAGDRRAPPPGRQAPPRATPEMPDGPGSPARRRDRLRELALQPRVQRGLRPRLLHAARGSTGSRRSRGSPRRAGSARGRRTSGRRRTIAACRRPPTTATAPGPVTHCRARPGCRTRLTVRVDTRYRARLRRRYAATVGGAATAAATPSAVITASRMPSAPLPGTVDHRSGDVRVQRRRPAAAAACLGLPSRARSRPGAGRRGGGRAVGRAWLRRGRARRRRVGAGRGCSSAARRPSGTWSGTARPSARCPCRWCSVGLLQPP